MSSFEDRVYTGVVAHLRVWVAKSSNADDPIIGSGDGVLSPRQILREVEQKTPFGVQLVERWFDLALDHILSATNVSILPKKDP